MNMLLTYSIIIAVQSPESQALRKVYALDIPLASPSNHSSNRGLLGALYTLCVWMNKQPKSFLGPPTSLVVLTQVLHLT